MKKAELRATFLAQRRALSAEEVKRRSLHICRQLLLNGSKGSRLRDVIFEPAPFTTIHTFLPIAHQNEVNTWLIIHELWQRHPAVQVAVPVANPTTQSLTHYLLTPETPLRKNQWGIPEPVGDGLTAIDSWQLEVVLVPLLAFDRQGHRAGYGGGYYDRFLAECRPDCLKIGLSLFEPVEQIDDVEPTDVPLSLCVTPTFIYTFNSF